MKHDTLETFRSFFEDGKFDSRLNITFVTLITKHDQACNIRDFRPISCCTTVYKVISKVMANRMSKVLGSIISRNQAAFVPGQKIHDHVLISYEIIRGCNWKDGMSGCIIQMDIRKAYDSMDWMAMKSLAEIGFPRRFIGWIMQVVTLMTYQFNLNGRNTKSMKAARGLRQGDPIPPCSLW